MNCIEEDVIVEYGADNPSSECGSGFPTEKTMHLFPDDEVCNSTRTSIKARPRFLSVLNNNIYVNKKHSYRMGTYVHLVANLKRRAKRSKRNATIV